MSSGRRGRGRELPGAPAAPAATSVAGPEDDLPEEVPALHRGEAVTGVAQRHRGVDLRAQAAAGAEPPAALAPAARAPRGPGAGPGSGQSRRGRSSSSRVPIVDPTTESWRKKIRVSSAGDASPL